MKITIESTTKITHFNSIPVRVWEGQTESGIKVNCFIARVSIDADEPRADEFKEELQEHNPPSPEIEAIPLRMIL